MKISKLMAIWGCFLVLENANATLSFSNDLSKFILLNDTSEIRIKSTGIYDNQDLGITNNLNRIDLVNSTNNVIIMDSDFELAEGFLSSVTCTVQGNGYSMIMNGDLTIPEMTTLKITSSLLIEGNGHTLFIDNFAQILTDTHATLTLRNLILRNSTNTSEKPAIEANGSDSKITFDGVEIKFNDDFWFKRGSLFFNNNVLYSGGSKFLYGSAQSSYIMPNSTLLFDKGTTFFYNPATTSNQLIVQQDPTSTIYFDGATLQTTPTGLSLINGQMFFENQINFDVGTEFNTSVFRLNQNDSGLSLRSLEWDFSGQFLAASGQTTGLNTNQIKIYQLNSTNLSQLDAVTYGPLSSSVNSAVWSSDGQYLAVGGSGAGIAGGFSNNDSLRIYYLNPATLTLNPVASVDFGSTATIKTIDWGGLDNRYLAVGGTGALPVGGFGNNDNLRIYYFDAFQNKLNAVTSYNFGDSVNSAQWDFSGSYLAVGGFQTSGSCRLNLFTFNPVTNALSLFDDKNFGVTSDTSINSIAWTSESQFLAVGGGSYSSAMTSTQNLIIYQFNPSNPVPLSFLTSANSVETTSTSYIQIQNLKWSSDNQLLLSSGINPISGNWSSDIYVFDSSSNIKLSELKQMSHASALVQYAAAWNPNVNLFATSSDNFININSLVGLSPKLVSNKDYTNYYSNVSTGTDGVYSMDWHPGGDYLAVAGQSAGAVGGFSNSDEIRIYRFGGGTESLHAAISSRYGQRVCAASWRPDGDYLAVGGINPTYAAGGFNNTDQVRIYGFTNNSLSPAISVSLGSSSAELYSMAWHPSGRYLALGCYNSEATGGFLAGVNLRIYSFDGTILTPIVGYDFGSATRTPAGMHWSPDGKYLAVGTCDGRPTSEPVTGNGLRIFEFQNDNSLVSRATWNTSGAVLSVNWEFDNRFIAVTYNNTTFKILYFTGSSIQEMKSWGDANFKNTDVKFSPDGKKIAYTAKNGASNNFGYLSIDDVALKNESFNFQKISGIFNLWSAAWRPDSKYLAVGAYNVGAGAQQISVFKVENLININRDSAEGLSIGNLVDANVLGNGLIIVNGVMEYAAE